MHSRMVKFIKTTYQTTLAMPSKPTPSDVRHGRLPPCPELDDTVRYMFPTSAAPQQGRSQKPEHAEEVNLTIDAV